MSFNADYYHEAKIQQEHIAAIKIKEYQLVADGRVYAKKIPENLLQRNPGELIGRKILQYNIALGDYGDGSGPGFLGVLLESDAKKGIKKEWLVITIQSASSFALLDSKWVCASALFSEVQKPLIHYEGAKLIDDFGPAINESIVQGIELKDESFVLVLRKSNTDHTFEILNRDARLTPFPGIAYDGKENSKFKPRMAFPSGRKIGEYIIFMDADGQIKL